MINGKGLTTNDGGLAVNGSVPSVPRGSTVF